MVYGPKVTEDDDDSSRRRDPRDSVMLSASIRHDDTGEFTARVRNISPGGLKIDCPKGLPVGTIVEATLRNIGICRGTVAWSAGGYVGIQFETPIDPQDVMPQINVKRHVDTPTRPGEFRRPGLRLSDD